jgi:hypothetical protein
LTSHQATSPSNRQQTTIRDAGRAMDSTVLATAHSERGAVPSAAPKIEHSDCPSRKAAARSPRLEQLAQPCTLRQGGDCLLIAHVYQPFILWGSAAPCTRLFCSHCRIVYPARPCGPAGIISLRHSSAAHNRGCVDMGHRRIHRAQVSRESRLPGPAAPH